MGHATAGWPIPRRFTAAGGNSVTTTGIVVPCPGKTMYVQVSNESEVVIRMYTELSFYAADAALNQNEGYIRIKTHTDGGFFAGPVELSGPNGNLYFRAESGIGELEVVFYQARA